jgi:thiol:disulfide interchange protein DsbA
MMPHEQLIRAGSRRVLPLLLPAVAAICLVLGAATFGSPALYVEGTHYVLLPVPITPADADRIEVTEYFSYTCSHCRDFDPVMESWSSKLPSDVVFKRTPAIWHPSHKILAQAYFAADALNVLGKIHPRLFVAIQDERRRFAKPEDMARFFSEQGVDPVDFQKVFQSFGVDRNVRQADAHGKSYKARGVPTLIVNGKYRIESGMTSSNASMLKIVDFLVEKERTDR